MIQWSVQQKAGFNIRDISPITSCQQSRQQQQGQRQSDINGNQYKDNNHKIPPALFVAGNDDDFIRPHHSERLYQEYGGEPKQLLLVPGDHNDPRPPEMFDAVQEFFDLHLGIDQAMKLSLPPDMDITRPPWHQRAPYFQARPQEQYTQGTSIGGRGKDDKYDDIDGDGEEGQEVLGMTKERQNEIQSRVVQLLGTTMTMASAESATHREDDAS
jgi:hypothetical protein